MTSEQLLGLDWRTEIRLKQELQERHKDLEVARLVSCTWKFRESLLEEVTARATVRGGSGREPAAWGTPT